MKNGLEKKQAGTRPSLQSLKNVTRLGLRYGVHGSTGVSTSVTYQSIGAGEEEEGAASIVEAAAAVIRGGDAADDDR